MTFSELRDDTRFKLFDRGFTSWPPAAAIGRAVNAGVSFVGELVAAQQSALLLTSGYWNVTRAIDKIYQYLGDPNNPPLTYFPPIYRLVDAWGASEINDSPSLAIIPFGEIDKRTGDPTRPYVFLYQQTIGALRPETGTIIQYTYVARLPEMTADADTPGQTGGQGVANLLPTAYHPLISDFAAADLIAAEGRVVDARLAMLRARAEVLGLALPERTEVRGEAR